MTELRPRTKPTARQMAQMNAQLKRLVSDIGSARLQELAQCRPATVRSWLHRGYISATAAHLVCLSPDVEALGYTRETLRPDVEVWTI